MVVKRLVGALPGRRVPQALGRPYAYKEQRLGSQYNNHIIKNGETYFGTNKNVALRRLVGLNAPTSAMNLRQHLCLRQEEKEVATECRLVERSETIQVFFVVCESATHDVVT